MKLVKPTEEMEDAFMAMLDDYKKAGETPYQEGAEPGFDFARYVHSLNGELCGTGMKPGYVPSTTYWLMDDENSILGVCRLRHYLTPALKRENGNIGYDVPPSLRRRGYATLLLKLALEKARELGLQRVLITCDTDNIASGKVIRKNGGILEDEIISDYTGQPVSRYWIELTDGARHLTY